MSFSPRDRFRAGERALMETLLRLSDRVLTRFMDSTELVEMKARSQHEMKKMLTWSDLMWFLIGVSLVPVSSFLRGTRPRKTRAIVVLLFGRRLHYACADHNYGQYEADDTEPSTSHPGQSDTKGYSYSSDLTNEFALDGEVGRRLDQMIPILHVPRINGEIPSIDEETSDHQRLLDNLQMYDFEVQGDGNCQLRSHPEIYGRYVPMVLKELKETQDECHQHNHESAELSGQQIQNGSEEKGKKVGAMGRMK